MNNLKSVGNPPGKGPDVSAMKDVDQLSTDEELGLKKLMNHRKKLSAYFETSFIVETVSRLIDESPFVDFESERSRKFIDKERPSFKLAVEITTESLAKYPHRSLSGSGLDAASVPVRAGIEHKTSIINGEIIDPMLNVLLEELQTIKDEGLEREREEIYRLLPDVKDLDHFFLPSIFKVMAESAQGKLLVLEYVI